MFGYVKTDAPSLRVREHELYRAIYCGLCRSIGRTAGQPLRFTLSYDFTFLAAVRLLAEGRQPTLARGACIAHPLKKRAYVEPCCALTYAALCSTVLTRGKVRDNIEDERGLSAFAAYAVSPVASCAVKRCARSERETVERLSAPCEKYLSLLSRLERERCASLDEVSDCFGELMGELFAAELPEKEGRICREIGRAVGRAVYICDAADDAAEDLRRGRYNPIIIAFGEDIFVPDGKKSRLKDSVAEGLYSAAMLHLSRAEGALELLCDGAPRGTLLADAAEIVRNTVYAGIPTSLARVLHPQQTAAEE